MGLPKLGLGDAFKEAISQSVTFEDEHEWALAIVKTPGNVLDMLFSV
jgi:hypothetical protein